ncbi:LysE family transporter [Clostridium sp. MCC353]|uniref:LysE/ArgO family amino acid transporter n=1 Tax=Clostridium sp. MCC353 TaxID=2592646 RepID=UPI002079C2B3|nr:LysE family transporter [Clostridium sp. MCC353]
MEYIQGLTMGLAYVAPIGMQNLFIINTALERDHKRSALTAFIVIFFDITLAFACYFGIGAVIEHVKWLEMVILLAGSLIVTWIGIGLLKAKSSLETSAGREMTVRKIIVSACVVTWFNPQAIIDGTMMLGAFRVSQTAAGGGLSFILGVASASCLWFSGLTLFVTLFSHKLNDRILRAINVICGCVIIFYGLKLLLTFLQALS